MHCKKIVNFSIYCVFPESIYMYLYTPHMEGHWKFLGWGGGGEGVGLKTQTFRRKV